MRSLRVATRLLCVVILLLFTLALQHRAPAAPITARSRAEGEIGSRPTVLVLSPLRRAHKHLARFFRNLEATEYPKDCLSLGFLVGGSDAGTLQELELQLELHRARQRFRRVSVVVRDVEPEARVGQSHSDRHALRVQYARRVALAKARNLLLYSALGDEQWVLWIDSDLLSWPPTVVDSLLASNKSIVAPNCVMAKEPRSYDLNSWVANPDIPYRPFAVQVPTPPVRRWSEAAAGECADQLAHRGSVRALQRVLTDALLYGQASAEVLHAKLAQEIEGRGVAELREEGAEESADVAAAYECARRALMNAQRSVLGAHFGGQHTRLELEGYGPRGALYVHKLQRKGLRLAELDAVGGSMLLVRADVHRMGINFPPYIFHGRIETEGLSFMAREAGIQSFALPFVEVVHP